MGSPSQPSLPLMQYGPWITKSLIMGLQTFFNSLQVFVRYNLQPQRCWKKSLNQMISLSPPRSSHIYTLLAWQKTLYWLYNERNTRLYANTFISVDTLFTDIDRQLKNKIQSFRKLNPTRSSYMISEWLA